MDEVDLEVDLEHVEDDDKLMNQSKVLPDEPCDDVKSVVISWMVMWKVVNRNWTELLFSSMRWFPNLLIT